MNDHGNETPPQQSGISEDTAYTGVSSELDIDGLPLPDDTMLAPVDESLPEDPSDEAIPSWLLPYSDEPLDLDPLLMPEDTPPTSPELFRSLTPEQQLQVGLISELLADKFSTKEVPLTPRDFGLVPVGEGSKQKLVVMLISGKGLPRGSYHDIKRLEKKNDKSYTISIYGRKIDTRKAMTWEAYEAFIIQSQINGVEVLADSPFTGEWSGTWLTGNNGDGKNGDFGYADEHGQPVRRKCNKFTCQSLDFRPAVFIDSLR